MRRSDDTDAPTRALLAANDNFGMSAAALTVLKQDKVAALSDANAVHAPRVSAEIESVPRRKNAQV